jgi:hypothetical protein
VVVLVAAVGLTAGGVAALALLSVPLTDEQTDVAASPDPEPPADVATGIPSAPAPRPDVRLLLAWTPAALPEGLVEELATIPGVEATTVVAGDVVDLVASHDAEGRPVDVLDDGWVVPLDALAIDPATYAAILPQGAQPEIAKLTSGQVVEFANCAAEGAVPRSAWLSTCMPSRGGTAFPTCCA